jgi:SAM-dependent methyltransferase
VGTYQQGGLSPPAGRLTSSPATGRDWDTEDVEDRYWFDNSLADEGTRLRLLEAIADPRSIRLLDGLHVEKGWRCAELGAGGGSMALWLAHKVGIGGSVVAVDRDTTLLNHLVDHPTIEIVDCPIEDLDITPGSFDLIHTRNVLMHLDFPDTVIGALVEALRPGGVLLVEEADYFPVAGMTSPALAQVASALVGQWTWARTIPNTLARLPVVDLAVTIDTAMLQGGSAEAAFWTHTFRSVEDRLTDPDAAAAHGVFPVGRAAFEEAMGQLADEAFWTPFSAVVCAGCRKS